MPTPEVPPLPPHTHGLERGSNTDQVELETSVDIAMEQPSSIMSLIGWVRFAMDVACHPPLPTSIRVFIWFAYPCQGRDVSLAKYLGRSRSR